MANGATGTFTYQDFTYSNCVANDCNTTGAALSGGTGKLTDGVSPATDWNQEGQNTLWVGWDSSQGLLNPTVTFFFGSTVTINTITVWTSNDLSGGVAEPGTVVIGGTPFVVTPDGILTPHALTFTGLNITGTSTTVQFDQAAGFHWDMIGEVSFASASAVPEPGTLALLGLALPGLVLLRRSRWLRSRKQV